jgi:diguanylate cyclase (GGDEF)-like protein/putative nucleotidyltransferase with HDIG domain
VSSAPRLTGLGRTYLLGVVILGFLLIGESLFSLYRSPIDAQWLLLALLTLISGSASIELPGANVSISISEAFVFTAVLLYGPSAGTLTVALDGLVISFWIAKRRPEIHRALFNIAAPALSAWCSAHLFFILSGIAPLSQQPATLNQILPSLVVFALGYFLLNSWLIASVIAFQKQVNPYDVWRGGFIWLSLNYFCGASVAVLLVGYNRTIDLRFVAVVVPLLLVLYFTFKTSMQRVEDANKHVEQLNALYLSTIETLAMAVDAKDQVTHGHIRRVQTYAVSLAREIGVRDMTLIKAIETAALLHDMGKLAVPEYILNKPGKLTAAEFEKMKLHASVGADILSAIAFPYPVVPIVRHHHENWDGTGYPDGLKQTAIPIGARVLSVVDCFDALTSDRPYRPRLSEEEALRILTERRGSMYDPLVVDTFLRVHDNIAPTVTANSPSVPVLKDIATARQIASTQLTSTVVDEIASSAEEMSSMHELTQVLTRQVTFSEAADAITKHLRGLIPSTLAVFYIYDVVADELEAVFTTGDAPSALSGMRIPLGQRLSGWVGANRQTISNSDAALDLGDAAHSFAVELRSCISTPLVARDELVGVLTLYSATLNGFNDSHCSIIEGVGRQAALILARARELDNASLRETFKTLPDLRQLQELARSSTPGRSSAGIVDAYALLFIDVGGLGKLSSKYGPTIVDEVLIHIARRARYGLRTTDVLFRTGDDELVAFLYNTDINAANMVAGRIRNKFSGTMHLTNGSVVMIETKITAVCAPDNWESLADLLNSARRRESTAVSEPTGSSLR